MKFYNIILITLLLLKLIESSKNEFETTKKLILSLISNRIVNGQKAKPGQFPYQVLIMMMLTNNSGGFLCGAAIIGDRYVLTAAHCFIYNNTNTLIFAGIINHQQINNSNTYLAESILTHEHFSYDESNTYNDIAIVKTNRNFRFTNLVKKLILPHKQYENVECTVAGFGSTTKADAATKAILMHTKITLLSRLKCLVITPKKLNVTYKNQLCADEKSTGTCVGDSGSPVVYQNQVVGIASHIVTDNSSNDTSCVGGYPTVYTNVYKYLDWIHEKSGISPLVKTTPSDLDKINEDVSKASIYKINFLLFIFKVTEIII